MSLRIRAPRTFVVAALTGVTLLSACGGDKSTGTVGPPASVSVQAGDNQTATVGQAVATRPSVIVRDAEGRPVPGASVTFAVVSGGGSATGTTATTDANGVATVGRWTLGTTAGTNTLTASVTGLTPFTFTATGTPGPAASLAKQAGDNQTAAPGAAVPVAPSVVVRDQYNNPVPGVTVTFAVASGGGSITGATQVTSAAGVATVGAWTLGPNPGANTLTATVSGAAGPLSVTFTATAGGGPDACTTATPLAVPSTVNGALSTTDCQLLTNPPHYADIYEVTVSTASSLVFDMSSTFDVLQFLVDANGNLVAFNDDRAEFDLNSSMRVLVPAGVYGLFATSFDDATTGPYTLSAGTASAQLTGCADDIQRMVWMMPGLTTTQSLGATDCNVGTPATPFWADRLAIFLERGRSYTITQTSTEFAPDIRLRDADDNLVAGAVYERSTTTSRVRFTPTVFDAYIVELSSVTSGATGQYTLTVEAGPSPAVARAGESSAVQNGRTWVTRRKAAASKAPAGEPRRASP